MSHDNLLALSQMVKSANLHLHTFAGAGLGGLAGRYVTRRRLGEDNKSFTARRQRNMLIGYMVGGGVGLGSGIRAEIAADNAYSSEIDAILSRARMAQR